MSGGDAERAVGWVRLAEAMPPSPVSLLSSLSPRRRVLVAAVAVLVAAIVAAAVAVRGGSKAHPAAAQNDPGPVLLVPGYGGSLERLAPLAEHLRAAGRSVVLVSLPGDATGPLAGQATAVDAAVTSAERSGAPSVDVVGYSDGGVVVRWWARHEGGSWRARRIVTIASPQHGTDLAAAVAGDGRLCLPACRDVQPESRFLAELNAKDETPDGPRWVSVYSTTDGVVRPPDSARLDGATNIALQSVCPDDRSTHSEVPEDPLTIAIVTEALGTGPVRQPGIAQCSALRAAGS
jgi:triacylglycerol lipase